MSKTAYRRRATPIRVALPPISLPPQAPSRVSPTDIPPFHHREGNATLAVSDYSALAAQNPQNRTPPGQSMWLLHSLCHYRAESRGPPAVQRRSERQTREAS